MTEIKINPGIIKGRIKPMHGVGQPPRIGTDTKYFFYLKDANIPYSRLHDVGGWFGNNLFCDIPNIFRDFSADVNDPASYDFVFTDIILKGLIDNNCEPYFRLGVTIENFHKLEHFRIDPPSDNRKWAEICEHVIRHYNEGWANGFRYNIKYWEIWNEPDGGPEIEDNAMWKGTKEQYFDLYRITSKHLRKCFGNSIKIGGYASCGFYYALTREDRKPEDPPDTEWQLRTKYFLEFFEEFLQIVKDESLPLDFFSHHSYDNVRQTLRMQKYCEKTLAEYGFENVEIHMNEWNTDPRTEDRGTSKACSDAVAMMCAMQHTKMAVMCYYDARIDVSVYGGLFNPLTYKPLCPYYGFLAFGRLYAMGSEIECLSDNDGIYCLAATDGAKNGILITNNGEDTDVYIENIKRYRVYGITEEEMMTEKSFSSDIVNMKQYQTLYLETK